MLSGEKILITGPAGRIAVGLTRALAPHNEVWGIARFSRPESRREIEALGVTTRAIDLATGELGDLPRDFTYLLHLAASFEGLSYDRAIQINAEPAGFLLEHCRKAKAALIMSTVTVYKPHPDPWHLFREDDALGDVLAFRPETYSIAKISEEAIARYCARAYNVPVTIARMNSAYSVRGGLPINQLQAIVEGRAIESRWNPLPYSPIHEDDIAAQVEALLGAASVPATIVNWCGDEVVSVQQWAAYMADLTGLEPKLETKLFPGGSIGAAADATKRRSITGPCTVSWKEGIRRVIEARYPGGIKTRHA